MLKSRPQKYGGDGRKQQENRKNIKCCYISLFLKQSDSFLKISRPPTPYLRGCGSPSLNIDRRRSRNKSGLLILIYQYYALLTNASIDVFNSRKLISRLILYSGIKSKAHEVLNGAKQNGFVLK